MNHAHIPAQLARSDSLTDADAVHAHLSSRKYQLVVIEPAASRSPFAEIRHRR